MIKKIIKENYIYLIIIALLIIVFSIIMRSSLHGKIILFDKMIFTYINKHISYALVAFFKILTNFGDIYIPCIILLLLLLFKNKWVFLLQGCSYALAGIITYIAKLAASRPRPEIALIKIPKSSSFPSGHTLTSIVFYTIIFFLLTRKVKDKKKRIIVMFVGLIFALLIGTSRVYLGVHYLSDVLGGIIIAIPCLLMCINIIRKNFKEKLKDIS